MIHISLLIILGKFELGMSTHTFLCLGQATARQKSIDMNHIDLDYFHSVRMDKHMAGKHWFHPSSFQLDTLRSKLIQRDSVPSDMMCILLPLSHKLSMGTGIQL